MASGKYINIDYPFKNSPQGFFLNLNSDDQRAIKAESYGIYCIKNIINGKQYIGSCSESTGFKRRWIVHKSQLKNNRHFNKHLQASWNKYGSNVFIFYVLEIIDNQENLYNREDFFIKKFNTSDDIFGYNIAKTVKSPMLGIKHTQDAKDKISYSLVGNKRSLGYKHTEETRTKMSIAQKNMLTDVKIKRGKSLIGNKNGVGIKPVNRKPVMLIDDMGGVKRTWDSATDAAKELSLDVSNIIKVCKNIRKTCSGLKFSFKNG